MLVHIMGHRSVHGTPPHPSRRSRRLGNESAGGGGGGSLVPEAAKASWVRAHIAWDAHASLGANDTPPLSTST